MSSNKTDDGDEIFDSIGRIKHELWFLLKRAFPVFVAFGWLYLMYVIGRLFSFSKVLMIIFVIVWLLGPVAIWILSLAIKNAKEKKP